MKWLKWRISEEEEGEGRSTKGSEVAKEGRGRPTTLYTVYSTYIKYIQVGLKASMQREKEARRFFAASSSSISRRLTDCLARGAANSLASTTSKARLG